MMLLFGIIGLHGAVLLGIFMYWLSKDTQIKALAEEYGLTQSGQSYKGNNDDISINIAKGGFSLSYPATADTLQWQALQALLKPSLLFSLQTKVVFTPTRLEVPITPKISDLAHALTIVKNMRAHRPEEYCRRFLKEGDVPKRAAALEMAGICFPKNQRIALLVADLIDTENHQAALSYIEETGDCALILDILQRPHTLAETQVHLTEYLVTQPLDAAHFPGLLELPLPSSLQLKILAKMWPTDSAAFLLNLNSAKNLEAKEIGEIFRCLDHQDPQREELLEQILIGDFKMEVKKQALLDLVDGDSDTDLLLACLAKRPQDPTIQHLLIEKTIDHPEAPLVYRQCLNRGMATTKRAADLLVRVLSEQQEGRETLLNLINRHRSDANLEEAIVHYLHDDPHFQEAFFTHWFSDSALGEKVGLLLIQQYGSLYQEHLLKLWADGKLSNIEEAAFKVLDPLHHPVLWPIWKQGQLNAPSVQKELITLYAHEEAATLHGLFKLWKMPEENVMVHYLKHQKGEDPEAHIRTFLSKFKDKANIIAVASYWGDEGHEYLRKQLLNGDFRVWAEAILAHPEPKARRVLYEVLAQGKPRRSQQIYLLERLVDDEAAVPAIFALSKLPPHPTVFDAIVSCLEVTDHPSYLPFFIEHLDHTNKELAKTAMNFVRTHGDISHVEHLHRLMKKSWGERKLNLQQTILALQAEVGEVEHGMLSMDQTSGTDGALSLKANP